MKTPNEDLTQLICAELQNQGLATPSEIGGKGKVKNSVWKVKAEDWYSLFENSLPKTAGEVAWCN